jgi:hypothetical protein
MMMIVVVSQSVSHPVSSSKARKQPQVLTNFTTHDYEYDYDDDNKQ